MTDDERLSSADVQDMKARVAAYHKSGLAVQTACEIPLEDFYGKAANEPAAPPDAQDIVARTIAERGKVYGEPHLSHLNIGLAWTGAIQQHYGLELPHPLPASVVELMMVQFKAHRAVRVYHADNYVDLKAYAKFAEESQLKEAKERAGK